MIDSVSPDPTATCQQILKDLERDYRDVELLQSETEVIACMQSRTCEMADAYRELHTKLSPHPHALETFLGVLIATAAFWNPERVAEAREGRRRLKSVNRLIADRAAELASLVREREELHDESGFAGDTHYHVCCVIEDAAHEHHLYQLWVRDKLRALRGQFSLKYWPRIGDFLDALARDAKSASLEATDSITAAATTGPRGSRVDFFKALFAAIDENGTAEDGLLPADFKLSDDSYASLANCVLDLDDSGLIDGAYVKRLRQRARERQ